jgi:hypothetical protein
MTIFRLVEFEADEHVTLLHRGPTGSFAVTYMVVPQGEECSRLLVPPRVDEHSTEVDADPDATWQALERVLFAGAGGPARLLARLLGATEGELPGFRVARSEPARLLDLEGKHRFARYRLRFELEPLANGGTRLAAVTDADFPGAAGGVYRALVIGTRGHVLAVRRILGAVASAARRTPRRTGRRRP